MKKEKNQSDGLLRSRSGVVLLLVLWVLTLLTVISGEFCRAMRTETTISRNFRDSTQAYYAAIGGIQMAIHQLLQKQMPPDLSTSTPDPESVGTAPWRINAPTPRVIVGSASADIRMYNESGKININLADEKLLRLLVEPLDIQPADKDIIVASILDWRDADDLYRLNGAENDYYQSLEEPYECRNGDFESPEELLLVRGVTPEMFGDGLSQMVTIFPGVKNLGETIGWRDKTNLSKGLFDYNRININAMSPDLMQRLPGFTDELVDQITAFRQDFDIRSDQQLIDIIGIDLFSGVRNYLTYDVTPYYRIQVVGNAAQGEAHRRISTLVKMNALSFSDDPYQIVEWLDHVAPDEFWWVYPSGDATEDLENE